jgi:transposase
VYPSVSMTDAQWAVLGPLLPAPASEGPKGGRPEKHPRRRVLDAIFYVVRGGIAWALLPKEFPPRSTVYDAFRRWTDAGVWTQVHDTLRERLRIRAGRSPLPTAAVIDSQSLKGADTVPSATSGWDGGKKIRGRKRHIAVDSSGLLLMVLVTMASIQDRDGGIRLLAMLRAKFSTITLIWADGGYAGRLLTFAKQVLTFTIEIVKRTDDQAGFKVLPRRWVVERSLGWLVKHRRLVRDYETRPQTHEAMVTLASIATMTRRLAR